MFQSCQRQEIVFPIEEHQFAEKAGYILIEVTAPNETATNKDTLFISGAFSDGKKIALMPAEYMDYKYGIYLDPNNFANGRTLADGYRFSSKLSGSEMASKTDTLIHYQTVSIGGRLDISLAHWEMFYSAHNGYVMYVENNSTWGDELSLYAWQDGQPELFGPWPGIPATGTEIIDGVEYTYFDLQTENTGKTYNFILNDNGKGNQKDAVTGFEINRDIYLELTDNICKEKGAIPGHKIYVINHTGWWPTMRLHAYDAVKKDPNDERNPLVYTGDWPGISPSPITLEIGGYTYYVFELPASSNDQRVNLLFNNGDDEKTTPESRPFLMDKDYYIQLVVDGGPIEVDPDKPEEIIKPDLPEGDMVIRANKPDAWENLYIYSSGYTNDWPGSLMEDEGDGIYSFELPRGAAFVFNSAPIGNQTAKIKGIKDNACFQIENNGMYQKITCE